MLRKTIKYTDYNGVTREEDFYFNLSKSELSRMYFAQNDFAGQIRKIIQTKDTKQLLSLFEEIILQSYGEKSDDGKRFIKKRNGVPLAEEFIESPAFDSLYFEMIQNPDEFASFLNSLIPPDLAAEVQRMQDSGEVPEELKGLV